MYPNAITAASGFLGPLVFLVVSPGCFTLATHWLVTIACAGAWKDIAAEFPGGNQPEGETFRFRQLSICYSVFYCAIVTIVVSPAGLFMRLPGPYRFRHRPILIPWTAVSAVMVAGMRPFRAVTIRFGAESRTIAMTFKIFNAAREYLEPKVVPVERWTM